jgi:hypothetical protein
MGLVKTTIELPDLVFRKAKAAAAQRGASLKDLFTEAVEDLLRRQGDEPTAKPWERAFGGLHDLRLENRKIERLIDAEFGAIDEDEWR